MRSGVGWAGNPGWQQKGLYCAACGRHASVTSRGPDGAQDGARSDGRVLALLIPFVGLCVVELVQLSRFREAPFSLISALGVGVPLGLPQFLMFGMVRTLLKEWPGVRVVAVSLGGCMAGFLVCGYTVGPALRDPSIPILDPLRLIFVGLVAMLVGSLVGGLLSGLGSAIKPKS